MKTMKAVRIHEFNGLEVVRYEDIPVPSPGAGQVLLAVHAAGVNPVDWQLTYGINQEFMQRALPTIPGFDVAGVVVETGAEVSRFSVGDAVYGQCDFRFDGSFADYMVSSVHRLDRKPGNLDFVEAASVPVGAMAAWDGLFRKDAIDLQAGQTLLVHGAAGGVGVFAVQFAKWRQARVIATGSAYNRDFLLDLGADRFIDYHNEAFEDCGEPVDAVLDAIGGDTQLRSRGLIRPGGVLASLVGEQWHGGPERDDIRKVVVHGGFIPEQLPEISRLLEAGTVRPVISHIMPLNEFAKALALSKTGHVRGKIVLQIR